VWHLGDARKEEGELGVVLLKRCHCLGAQLPLALCVCVCVCACVCACVCVCVDIYAHTYAHTHTHTYLIVAPGVAGHAEVLLLEFEAEANVLTPLDPHAAAKLAYNPPPDTQMSSEEEDPYMSYE
jgi:hypothetical protein